MALIRRQLIEIIEWTDDSRDTLSYRFPDEDKEIKRGAQLILRESQMAQFVYLGQFGDLFGPGKHTLTTANIPVLTRRVRVAFQSRRLFRDHSIVHGQQVGNIKPGDGSRPGPGNRPVARFRHL